MLAKTKTCAVVGMDGHVVEVEVDISPGLPAFHIVGLPDLAVSGITRARARRDQEQRRRVPDAADNGQPCAC